MQRTPKEVNFGVIRKGAANREAAENTLSATRDEAQGGKETRQEEVVSTSGPQRVSKRMYARQNLSEVLEIADDTRKSVGLRKKRPKSIFVLPDDVKDRFSRNTQFVRGIFSAETLLSPLPGPLADALHRNWDFLARTCMQFFDPSGAENAREAIPGLASKGPNTKVLPKLKMPSGDKKDKTQGGGGKAKTKATKTGAKRSGPAKKSASSPPPALATE